MAGLGLHTLVDRRTDLLLGSSIPRINHLDVRPVISVSKSSIDAYSGRHSGIRALSGHFGDGSQASDGYCL